MTTNPHPLQAALDRATSATYTAVDLLDIARARKPATGTREGRTDARQASLYKAVIASSVAAIEETFEALTVASLAGLGTPEAALARISTAIAKGMQSPNPQNLGNLLGDYLAFDAESHWSAHLAHSPSAYRRSDLADQTLDHRLLYTAYTQFREFKAEQLSQVLGRFVKIRNSFAHQDTSSTIFTRPEQNHLRTLRGRKAESDVEIEFVESVSATCAVTLDAKTSPADDPIVRWTIHETQAVNALLMYIGLVASSTSALAVHLQDTGGIDIASFEPLVLRVQTGRWRDLSRDHDFSTENVSFMEIAYKPSAR